MMEESEPFDVEPLLTAVKVVQWLYELRERIGCAIHVLRGRPLMYRMHLERGVGVINLAGEVRNVRVVKVVLDVRQ